jgi:Retrotransposon gag protein
MDAQQFQLLLTALTDGLQNLAPAQQQAQQGGAPAPKINIRIPTYKGAPEENVITWMLQCQNIFMAQGIAEGQQRIHYAATGFEGAALHWYLNRVQVAQAANNANVFADWAAFADALRVAFQPPNHQQYLRQQLKQLRQTGTIQEYGMAFRNLLGQIDNMAEEDKIAYFVEGMKPST